MVFKNNGQPVRHKAEITKSTSREVNFEPVIYVGAWKYLKLMDTVRIEVYQGPLGEFKIINDEDKKASGWL